MPPFAVVLRRLPRPSSSPFLAVVVVATPTANATVATDVSILSVTTSLITVAMRDNRFQTKYWIEPDIENRIWYARDVARIVSDLSLAGDVLPYFLDADATMTPAGGHWTGSPR